MLRNILDTDRETLLAWLERQEQPAFRANQIQHWLFHRRAARFEEMSELPQGLRERLEADFSVWSTQILEHRQADDGTEKLLLGLQGGGSIECVLLRDGARRSICVSSQVGCAMGCVFCASGLDGVDRNLTTGEIIEQMLRLQHLLSPDERLSHIVVMGMGEPLANLDRLLPALEIASHKGGLGISARRITISTVGLPAAIEKLTQRQTRYHLAVSLHAADDALRNELVPVNKQTGLHEILAAADRYFAASGRRLTYEYVLLANLNDSLEHAEQLVKLLRGRAALLNVIPYNPVAGLPYQTPSKNTVLRFREVLENGGLTVKFRQRKGDKIDAACGQLRRTAALQIEMPDAEPG